MVFFPNRTTFLQLGGLTIQWYAVCIVAGVLTAYYFAKQNLKTYRNLDKKDFLDDLLIWGLLVGIVCARLWYCLFSKPAYYFADPASIIRIWDGGLAIHGGIFGGLLAGYILCRKRNISFLKVADCVMPTILIGQCLGRWGNFVNQECYGKVVDASYYDGILRFIKDDMFIDGAYREPMFLYESLLCLLGFVLINFVLRRFQNKRGDLLYAYLMWYGLVRFFIEGRRTDSLMLGPLKMAQLISLAFLLLGLFLFIRKDKRQKKPTIIFDLDGTLQDSEKAIIATYAELFKRHDDPANFTPERKIAVLGPTLQEMFAQFWPQLDSQALFKEYQLIIKDKLAETLTLMPNAKELLATLHEQGYHVGIVSTRIKESGLFCLELLGIADYIEDYLGADGVKKCKPDPEALFKIVDDNHWNSDDVVMIGDSSVDVKAGMAYGAYTIAYISKEEKREAIEALSPNRVVNDLSEIIDILQEDHYFTYNLK